jgi:predicted RNA polymerase sigma factor
LRAHLLQQQGRHSEAREACARAIGLSTDEASRQFLVRQLAALG